MAALDRGRAIKRIFLSPLILAFPSTVLIFAGGLFVVTQPSQPAFRPGSEVAMFEYLRNHSVKNQVVISSYETANALPAWAPLRVILGHGPESVQHDLLGQRVHAFFTDSGSEDERKALIHENDINYVIWGPAERKVGDWDPRQVAYLELIIQIDQYYLFRVTNRLP
jgi:hypothetical protein